MTEMKTSKSIIKTEVMICCKKVASLFSQILAQVARIDFEKLVMKHGAERHAKGFRSWIQFVAMLFCQLADC